MQVISPLLLHDFFDVSLLETKASILKANGSVAEPFSNGILANKELVARPACFHDVLQPPMTDSLLFAYL
jgi:hypothetical protein